MRRCSLLDNHELDLDDSRGCRSWEDSSIDPRVRQRPINVSLAGIAHFGSQRVYNAAARASRANTVTRTR